MVLLKQKQNLPGHSHNVIYSAFYLSEQVTGLARIQRDYPLVKRISKVTLQRWVYSGMADFVLIRQSTTNMYYCYLYLTDEKPNPERDMVACPRSQQVSSGADIWTQAL